jgi:formate hydrogenlyase subunit 6/NADH:ubiquinone oxidoreductase subunit I
MGGYFSNITSAFATTFEALSVTFSHLFRKPYTVQYPDRIAVRIQDTLPYRYRGILEVDLEICTGCLACERACPIDCIVIEAEKDKNTKEMILRRFDIDIAKCMYCGLCSEPCPTGSIHHTREFEGADYSLESLVKRFVRVPVAAYKPKKTGEDDPAILPILERGMRYIEEFATPDTAAGKGDKAA